MSKKAKQCGTKIRFRSHAKALNFIGSHFRSLRLAALKVYLCPHCNRFHIGHNDGKGKEG